MKVGDYVRTKDGVIAKIEDIIADYSIDCDRDVFHVFSNNEPDVMEIPYVFKDEYIIKSSPNILDLIEYGDIVKYKIDDEEFISEVWGEKNDYFVQNFDVPIDLRDLNIVSIVTKEQFSQMEYRIKE